MYASVKLPCRNIEGVSASKTSKVFARNTSQMFPLVRRTNSGVHTWLLNVHGMSVANVLKSPMGGAISKWGRKGNRAN